MSLGNVQKNAEMGAALRAGFRISGGCCPSERGSPIKQQHYIRAAARREWPKLALLLLFTAQLLEQSLEPPLPQIRKRLQS
jgi:hypothetical protein